MLTKQDGKYPWVLVRNDICILLRHRLLMGNISTILMYSFQPNSWYNISFKVQYHLKYDTFLMWSCNLQMTTDNKIESTALFIL